MRKPASVKSAPARVRTLSSPPQFRASHTRGERERGREREAGLGLGCPLQHQNRSTSRGTNLLHSVPLITEYRYVCIAHKMQARAKAIEDNSGYLAKCPWDDRVGEKMNHDPREKKRREKQNSAFTSKKRNGIHRKSSPVKSDRHWAAGQDWPPSSLGQAPLSPSYTRPAARRQTASMQAH